MDHPSGMPGTQGSREVAAKAGAMERPEYYLELAEGSMEAVQKMSCSLKFNNEQCVYLADKLKVVVQSGSSFLEVLMGRIDERFSSQDSTGLAEIFKLLVALGKQVESFVEGCCKDAWIQAAMSLANVSQYVSSLGFNLELCRIAFCVDFAVSGCLLSSDEVADINKTEADIVEKKASADKDLLLEKVTQTVISSQGEDRDLAGYLNRRLMRFGPKPTFEDGTLLSELFALFALVKPGAEQVGRGASATVYKAKWLGTWVAKKTFEGSENVEFDKEAEILSRLCHPNITSMFCCAKKRWNCSIIMELMDGDLHHLMERKCDESADSDCAPFPILEAVDIMDQIGEGVKYLHNEGIVHRDLKSKNILYKKARNSENGYVHVKVTDFGISKSRDKSYTYSDLTFNVGSNRWMPPEVISLAVPGSSERTRLPRAENSPTYPFKVDTYSFGMVCYEILTGHRPFHGNHSETDIKRRVMEDGERPKLPDDCPLKLRTLIEKCWSQQPTERPTFAYICGELKYLKYLLMSESKMHLDAHHKPESNEGEGTGPVDTSHRPSSHSYKSAPLNQSDVEAMRSFWEDGKIRESLDRSRMVQGATPIKLCDSVFLFCQPKGPAQLEVVFVHGLVDDNWEDAYWKTWLARDGTPNNVWPMTWLPAEFPFAQVYALKYDASIKQTATDGMMDLFLVGENLVQEMVNFGRIGQNGVPVVFVCHGFGGLVAKQIVVSAKNRSSQDRKAQNLLQNIRGFNFYSTPHRGSVLAEYLHNAKRRIPWRIPWEPKGSLLENMEVVYTETSRLSEAFEKAKHPSWYFASKAKNDATYLWLTNSLREIVRRFAEGAKRFKGVRYRPDRRTWIAEMRPPKSKNKVSFGDFKCQIQAARAVDAAYHYFHKIHHINFADSCEILKTKPAPAEVSGEDKLRFVKEQAKWLASMAYSLPPTPTSAPARAAVDVALDNPFENFPESSRGFNAVTFRFRSFSEITPSSSSHTDKADDGISEPNPNFAAADHVGVVNEVEEGQSMFQWMLENAMVDPARSPVARKLSSSVQIIDELSDWTDSCSRILPSFLNSPGSEQRMMSPGLDVLSMSPPATFYLW